LERHILCIFSLSWIMAYSFGVIPLILSIHLDYKNGNKNYYIY
jgi:hypothetical protein